MTPDEALAYLQAFPDWERGTVTSAETYTLDRMRRLLDLLSHPDRDYGIVHVVGTKGKGSTAAMIAGGLRAAGYRTGLFSSPHLVDYRERIRVDGTLIPREALAAIVAARLRPAVERLRAAGEKTPLHFELLCALAFEHFRGEGVQAAVVEAGLGGRLDATNAVAATALTVITTIGYDHMAVLGQTLSAIAGEKAAVIRPRSTGGTVVSAPQPPEALAVIMQVCRERGADLQVVGREWQVAIVEESPAGSVVDVRGRDSAYERLRVPLAGAHQAANAATAVAALTALAPRYARLDGETIRQGLAATRWPGRLQIAAFRDAGGGATAAKTAVILDAAHNRESAAALAGALGRLYPGRRFVLVLSVFRDKDAAAVLAPLLPLVSRVIATATDHPRALPAATLAELARGLGVAVTEAPSVDAALQQARATALARGESVLVTGSLRTVGEAMLSLGIDAADE